MGGHSPKPALNVNACRACQTLSRAKDRQLIRSHGDAPQAAPALRSPALCDISKEPIVRAIDGWGPTA